MLKIAHSVTALIQRIKWLSLTSAAHRECAETAIETKKSIANYEKIEVFEQSIYAVCESVEVKNLTIVSDSVESSSGHNNAQLVKSAIRFLKSKVSLFSAQYSSDYLGPEYRKQFIEYINKVRIEFDQFNYDPDGVGAGTITDVVFRLKELSD
ncbi:hypothetical protein [Thalassotalea crassostreae]|uniref:hypothetical protein n=1 Tax=Thalassotalea crassostreae TaxID=1763536 RepID=UPI0008389027|nr:hypothetical protein [Thalassotalea crassostreae]